MALATGAVSGGSGPVKACVRASDGVIQVPKSGRCKAHARPLTINGVETVTVRGTPGAPGPRGDTGGPGQTGATGLTGDTGPAGSAPATPPAPYSLNGDTLVMRIDGGNDVPVATLAGCDQPRLSAPPRDCIVTVAGVTSDVVTWANDAIAGAGTRHNVDLIEVDSAATPVGGIHLDQAVISDVRFEDLDSSNTATWTTTLTLTPQAITPLSAPSLGASATVASQLDDQWTVRVNGLTMNQINAVDDLTSASRHPGPRSLTRSSSRAPRAARR